MSKYNLIINNPEREFFRGEVDKIVVRGIEGDIGILKGHANLVTPLSTGVLQIFMDGEKKYAALSGGFMKVDKQNTTILAATCEWADEINVDRATISQQQAEEKIKTAKSKHEIDIAELELKRSIARISTYSKFYSK